MKRIPSILVIGVLLSAIAAGRAGVHAQIAAGGSTSVDTYFADVLAKETAVRKALSASSRSSTLLKAVRTVVADFEAVGRRYPSSDKVADALWRAARLSNDAFLAFGDPREQEETARLFQTLKARYPSSALAKQGPASLSAVMSAVPAKAPVNIEPVVKAPAAPARTPRISKDAATKTAQTGTTPVTTTPATTRGTIATITNIRRAVLGDVVRIVIELDREVSFHDERIDNPARVFVDLPSTRAVDGLKDQTIRFDSDSHGVQQVRLGRHPNNTTRVVLESAGISSYSVYPLYSPYRLVIDCLRARPAETVAGTRPVVPVPPAAAPLASLVARRVEPSTGALPSATALGMAAIAEARTESAPASVPLAPVAPTMTAPPPSLPLSPPARNLTGGFSMARQLGLSVSRIVIDPGHGGHDPGAKGGGTTEAELVLDVSLRLEKLLGQVPGVEVVLTRRSDEYVTLQQRTAIANQESADLFLSIHANASGSTQVHGIETYFLNFATNLSTAAVAARENAASGQSMGELPDVVKTIALHNKLDESRDFATFVQREMMAKLRPANKTLRDLGVKQAPFVVLIGAAMPSVLTEISFMTNAQEARLLKSSSYREKIAEALCNAIRKYQLALKRTPTVARESQQ